MKSILLFIFLSFSIKSFSLEAPFLVKSDGRSQISLKNLTSKISNGSILILGELHDNAEHHKNQLDIVTSLIKKGHHVHLGMEFLNYTDQYEIYKYGAGITNKKEFLKAVNWNNSETFEFYSPILNVVHENGGSVIGLNIPRPITSKVAKKGVGSLNSSELALLPTPLAYGNEFYFERFYSAVGGEHVPDYKIQNYFWSQSIWDDVMSWRALEFMQRQPNDVLVVIVGDFHISYGGGLTEVIKRKGFSNVKAVSQTAKGDLSHEDLLSQIIPHRKYGPRSEWIWVTE